MARKKLSMRKIREALRLKASGLSCRAIARVCLIGKETVREYLGRAAEAGLTWPLPEGLSEEEIERRLFPGEPVSVRKIGRGYGPHHPQRLSAGTEGGIHAETPLALDSFRPQGHIMTLQRRFAPSGVRNEPESVAGFTGIYGFEDPGSRFDSNDHALRSPDAGEHETGRRKTRGNPGSDTTKS